VSVVQNGRDPFQEEFLRLERHAEGPEREFFAYVVAHEKAIEAFALEELANEPGSLEAVERLLER
jgi:hypothetical protein